MQPREIVLNIEESAAVPACKGDRFAGYAVIGLPFRSGHVLALRRFPASSVGPYDPSCRLPCLRSAAYSLLTFLAVARAWDVVNQIGRGFGEGKRTWPIAWMTAGCSDHPSITELA